MTRLFQMLVAFPHGLDGNDRVKREAGVVLGATGNFHPTVLSREEHQDWALPNVRLLSG